MYTAVWSVQSTDAVAASCISNSECVAIDFMRRRRRYEHNVLTVVCMHVAAGYTLYTLHRQCKNVFMFYVDKKFQRFLLSGNGTWLTGWMISRVWWVIMKIYSVTSVVTSVAWRLAWSIHWLCLRADWGADQRPCSNGPPGNPGPRGHLPTLYIVCSVL